MKHLTCMSEITELPTLLSLVESCGEASCADVCAEFGEKGCVGCPVQEAIKELHEYQQILFDKEGNPRTNLEELKHWIDTKPAWDPHVLGFAEGELVIYQNGNALLIGKIKTLCDDGAFVYYHEGSTAEKTPYSNLHHLLNNFVVTEVSLVSNP